MGKKKLKKKHIKDAEEILEALRYRRAAREESFVEWDLVIDKVLYPPSSPYDVSMESFVEWDNVIDKVLYPPVYSTSA